MKCDNIYDDIVKRYHEVLDEKSFVFNCYGITNIPELTDDDVRKIFLIYFTESKSLDDGRINIQKYLETKISHPSVDWSKENACETEEYKQSHYFDKVYWIFTDIIHKSNFEYEWVKLNGKMHTDEDAARLAAEKVMELCFDWHLQDNGALNEEHSFMMSTIATVFGNEAKNKVPEDVKKKAYDLFYGYFLGYLKDKQVKKNGEYEHFDDYQNWLRENVPSKDPDRFNWEYPDGELYCDYHPCIRWSTILENAGVDDNTASLICPWKTGISIRSVDNAVSYRTYQKQVYL